MLPVWGDWAPITPKSRKGQNTSSLIWMGKEVGGGVKSFLSILSKIAITDRINWNSQQIPLPPETEDEALQKPKCATFPSLILVGRGIY